MRNRTEQNLYLLCAFAVIAVIHLLVFTLWYVAQIRADDYVPVVPQMQYVFVSDGKSALKAANTSLTITDALAQHEAQMPTFGYDYEYVVGVVASECCGEPYEGQLAVVQCIVTTAKSRGLSPEEVVKLPNRYAEPTTDSNRKDLVRDACCDGIVLGYCATEEPIEYFYSTRNGGYSAWHEENLEFVMEIGNHRFFKGVS